MSVGLLVVSFGTTHLDTLEKAIEAVEKDLAGAYPEARFYRAFTSGVVRRRLRNEYGISVDSVKEAMARMQRDSVQRLVVQPTLLIPGEEYDRLRSEVMTYAGDMEVSMGLPLLWDDSDLDQMIGILAKSYPVPEDTVLLAMGHGTEHGANSLYTRLAQRMHRHHGNSIAVCTVEGQPDFSDVVAELNIPPVTFCGCISVGEGCVRSGRRRFCLSKDWGTRNGSPCLLPAVQPGPTLSEQRQTAPG